MNSRLIAFVGVTGVMAIVACAVSNAAPSAVTPIDADGSPESDGNTTFTDAGSPSQGCSADLHRMIDANGHVLMTCPDDQGCANGTCEPACKAASDSHGTLGCDFVVSTPHLPYKTPPCFSAVLSNTWPKPVHVTVTRTGAGVLDPTTFIRLPTSDPDATHWPLLTGAGVGTDQSAIVFLAGDPTSGSEYGEHEGCPVANAIATPTDVSGTGVSDAFHITTDFPVNAYDLIPFGGASSYMPGTSLLLPTSAWGSNYLAIATPPYSGSHKSDTPNANQSLQIIAGASTTKVTILPTVDLPAGGGVTGASKGVATTVTLAPYQFMQWYGQALAFSGTVVASDHPIAVETGGDLCLGSKTSSGGGCDLDHDMLPPVGALSSEYVAAPYTTRQKDMSEESIVYRVLGAANGTKLVYDPPVPGAPVTLNLGELAEVEAIGPFRMTSQDANHPFYVAQLMSGCLTSSGSRAGSSWVQNGLAPTHPFYLGCLGDEDHVGLVPPAQFLSHYGFFSDPTYGTTMVTVVRKRTASGFRDVRIDCLGTLSGWQAVDSAGDYQYTTADLRRVNGRDGDASVLTCNNGGHVADGDGPFGLVVWGLDYCASYGYPAGGNVATINTVVVSTTPN